MLAVKRTAPADKAKVNPSATFWRMAGEAWKTDTRLSPAYSKLAMSWLAKRGLVGGQSQKQRVRPRFEDRHELGSDLADAALFKGREHFHDGSCPLDEVVAEHLAVLGQVARLDAVEHRYQRCGNALGNAREEGFEHVARVTELDAGFLKQRRILFQDGRPPAKVATVGELRVAEHAEQSPAALAEDFPWTSPRGPWARTIPQWLCL